MSERGTTEDTRPVPAGASVEFEALKFEGGRYDNPGLPIVAMAELQRYSKLVNIVAHSIYLEQNPDRKRAPQGFADALDLRLTRVDRGSVVPVLERAAPEETIAPIADAYDQARDLINETFREIDEFGRIPKAFPLVAMGVLSQFGRSLADDEHIVFGRGRPRPAVVNRRVRERLGDLANLETIEVERVLIGRINGLRSDPSHGFDLIVAGPEKRRIEGTFSDPLTFDLLEEFMGYGRRAVLCSISVLAQQRRTGDLSISDVLGIEAALPPDWAARVAELADLRDGWLEASTPAPSQEVFDTLELILARCVDQGLPRPLIFPSGDGGIQLEWRESTVNVEVEILNNRIIESAWFEAEGDGGEERRFIITEIDPTMQFIAGHLR
ncbi:hypothetical protein [Nocardia huaxiensis]|uniref:hypothetical protein n=1 Tax=Nocardia huaxiensis TaxID=2755382 RepID=UPI001E510A8C|nr:hypothetical protein [Nocardia huaxiensis]UFS93749.1 hypothetical protein LPY97_23465 [Nocardia huaxiensis]